MYTAKYLSPMIPSFDLPETVSFFQEVPAFRPVMNESTYAVPAKTT